MPTEIRCKKCGYSVWERVEKLEYSCVKCGNLLFYTYGAPYQQIEAIMRSQRGDDFVRTPNGTIVPKYDSVTAKIKFIKAREREKQKCIVAA